MSALEIKEAAENGDGSGTSPPSPLESTKVEVEAEVEESHQPSQEIVDRAESLRRQGNGFFMGELM